MRRWMFSSIAACLLMSACTTHETPAADRSGNPVDAEAAASPLVPEDQIVSGGPPPDGIPPIDDPRFVDPDEAGTFLSDREPVIAVAIGGDVRAYPARILIWHEIVNDRVGGQPVSVTYCPLCNTGVVFRRPVINGELLDFGTSGMLYHSNLVMYDRQTRSLWPQALGRAIRGPLLGEELEIVPSQIVSFGDWRVAHPSGRVLSLETGVERRYGVNPYVGYDQLDSNPFLFAGEPDPRLPPKERVIGLRDGDEALAVTFTSLRRDAVGDWAVIETRVGDMAVLVIWKAGTTSAVDAALIEESREVGAAATFSPVVGDRMLTFIATAGGIVDEQTGTTWDLFGHGSDGTLAGEQLDRVVAIESFWFDWAAFFVGTEIQGGPRS